MSLRRTDTQRCIAEEDIRDWPAADALALGEAAAIEYENKVSAIKQYVSGASLEAIRASTGIERQYLYYLIERCQLADADGRPVGFLALVKGRHLLRRRRSTAAKLTAGRALPGALQSLFARYPTLEKLMYELIVHHRMPGSNRTNHRLNWGQIQEIFEDECVKLGIQPPNYPFSSNSNGRVALQRWGRKLRLDDQRRKNLAAISVAKDVSRIAVPSGCYERVECDGHYVDLNWMVEAPGLRGEGVVQIKVARLWLIALIETRSSAVIGYSVSLNKSNYSAADVARAVRSSLVPWAPRQLSISTISYRPGECLPNALDARLSYVCYDELWLDNAKSHQSDLFLSVLERTVNAVPVFGPRGSPNVRPNIEMIFDLLEEAGIHPLDGTTGANHRDPRRATKQEDRYLLKLDTVLDLIDLLVVRYNTGTAPGTTISRLDLLKRAVERETTLLRKLPLAQRQDCFRYDLFEVAKIGIDRERPVLRWRDARYFGSGLLNKPDLVGSEVLVMASSLDLRQVRVSLTADGSSLGILEVEPRWRNTPHTLWTRARVREKMSSTSFLRHAADIPRAMRAHVEILAKKDSHAKRHLAQLAVEQRAVGGPDARETGREQRNTAVDNDVIEEFDPETEELINRLGSIYR